MPVSVRIAAKFMSSGSRPASTSGSFQPTSSSAARVTVSRSDSGTPISSAMVVIGSRRDTCSTKSQSPVSTSSSTTPRARSRIVSSIRFIWRGVKAALTRPRSLVWRGASVARNESEASSSSGSTSSNMTPSPERNVAGSRLTVRTSAVAHRGPVAAVVGVGRHQHALRRALPGQRPLAAQGGEGGVALLGRALPELLCGEIDRVGWRSRDLAQVSPFRAGASRIPQLP